MKFFDGLYLYELVLLVLGALLFLALLIALMTLVLQGKPFARLLLFFVLPILMIGFPGIKSIAISKDLIKIELKLQDLLQNPTDSTSRISLVNELANLSTRPFSNPQSLVAIANAQIALGDNTAAEANVKKALNVSPQLPAALELKKRVELDRKLAELTTQLEKSPNDVAAKTQLANTVSEVAPLNIINPAAITNVARAQRILGDQVNAQANVDKALAIKPDFAPAILLGERMRSSANEPVTGN